MMRELFAACAVVAVASLVGCNKEEAPVDPGQMPAAPAAWMAWISVALNARLNRWTSSM